MDRSEAKDVLLKEFISNFDNTIPVNFNNKNDFYFTTGVATTKPSTSPFVRFWITNDNSRQITFASAGNRTTRRFGMINYQVFIPQNSGTEAGELICEEINDIFELTKFQDIYCYEGIYRESDIQDDGFFMFVGSIRYDFDLKK